jgi:mono/diheme cytochrome c family protein
LTRPVALLGAALVVAGAAAGAGYWWMTGSGEGWRFHPDDPAVVARGEAVYGEHCASCHGASLEGEADADGYLRAPPHDASGHTWHHPEELLFRITKLGTARAAGVSDVKTRMPAFESVLEDEEIVAALSYIKSTWPDDIRSRHDAMSAAR